MLAAQYSENSENGDVSTIEVKEIPKPKVEDGCVIVKVAAAAVNPVDCLVLTGATKGFGWGMPLPFTPGYDFAGTVDEVGSGVTDWKQGDEVFGVNWGSGSHDAKPVTAGSFAQYMLVDAKILSKRPLGATVEQAAAISLVGTTANEAITNCGVGKDTKKILVLGGSSAVGSLAIQLAKNSGCWVATTCSPRTKDYVKSLGAADLIIDYVHDKWETFEQVMGIDAVFDSVGEKDGMVRAKTILRPDGYFATIAAHEIGFDSSVHAPLRFCQSMVFSHNKASQDKLIEMIADGQLKITIDGTSAFTTAGVQEVMKKQKEGKSLGKNLVKM